MKLAKLASPGALNQFRSVLVAAPGPLVAVTTNLAAVISAGSIGETFNLAAGVFRITGAVTPKTGMSIIGQPGTIISGAQLVTGWTADGGSRWYADGQTQDWTAYTGFTCYPDDDRCGLFEPYYRDDVPLDRVTTLGAVAPGKFFLDKSIDRVYIGDTPTGHVVEAGVTDRAFLKGTATDVRLQGMIIEKFANPYAGARSYTAVDTSTGWVVEDNEIRLNHGIGVVHGGDAQILNNYIHTNGNYGIVGSPSGGLLESNEIAYNNWAGFDENWDAGGSKYNNLDGITIRDNHFHHNNGPGIWCDGNVINALIEDNICEYNTNVGIFHELAYDAVIRNNTLRENASIWSGSGPASGGDLYFGTSGTTTTDGIEVYGNYVETAVNGIVIKDDQTRTDLDTGDYGHYYAANIYVHDNTVVLLSGSRYASAISVSGTSSALTDNRFESNDYYVPDTTGNWWNLASTNKTWTTWNAAGHDDVGGTRTVGVP